MACTPTSPAPHRSSFALALLLAISTPLVAQDGNGPAASVTTQLPRVAVPSHYSLKLAPDAANLRFNAESSVQFALKQATRQLTLNAADLQFSQVKLTRKGEREAITGTVATDARAQTVTISFPREVTPGDYQLDFVYSGRINQQANGMFALDYRNADGADKRALFTQFEAPDARRVLPGWDEPSYKATYDLSLKVPAGQMAVSNMPVTSTVTQPDGSAMVSFGTTPKMSSYLLFFGMGELERNTRQVGATEVGVVTGKGNGVKAQFALDASAEILPWYNDYFGTAFPLPKLDNVAGPGQSQFFSAMENWGAIFTFEQSMLVDPKSTSESNRRRVYEIVAHEMAHQWFGDLVTMAWWDDLWLNEGFASWMATKVTDRMNPTWQMLLSRVDGREAAMGLDAYTTTHPVVQKIDTVDQVNQAFDTITYQKGEAVIAMLESYAGEEVWRNGIRAYMKAHAYGNTVTGDLWRAVEQAGAKGLTALAERYITQPGIPLVRVTGATCNNGSTQLQLEQSEFSRDAKAAKEAKPLSWPVPVKAQVLGGAEHALLMNGNATLTLDGCGPYVINAGQAGYFRSLYPAANVTALATNFTRLPLIDQRGLLADNWELGMGGYQSMASALNLVDAVPANASNIILSALPGYMSSLHAMFDDDKATQAQLLAYASKKLLPILMRIGFEVKPGEDAQVPLLRQSLVQTLGAMGEPAVLAEARRRFTASNPAELEGALKFIWLRIVAKYADQGTWDTLRKQANAAPTALERSQYFGLLGRVADDKLAQQALDLALTDEPGKTTSAALIRNVAVSHDRKAVDFVLANHAKYMELIDVSARTEALAELGGGSSELAMADTLEKYASSNLTPQSRKPTDRAIAAIRERVASQARIKPDVKAWIRGKQ